jgi:hypothetical protein
LQCNALVRWTHFSCALCLQKFKDGVQGFTAGSHYNHRVATVINPYHPECTVTKKDAYFTAKAAAAAAAAEAVAAEALAAEMAME